MVGYSKLKTTDKKKLSATALIILALPVTLILVKTVQDLRGFAAVPENLETEAGTLSPEWDDTDGIISFWGNVSKSNIIIRNNTFNLPSNQRVGWAIRLNKVNGGQVTGNEIPGMTVQCSSCTNVSISNNN